MPKLATFLIHGQITVQLLDSSDLYGHLYSDKDDGMEHNLF